MAMTVKNNLSAKNTLNQMDKNEKAKAKNLKNLASGMRINGAGDDASGYAISEKMQVQMRGLGQDIDNAQTGNSMLKVAEGGLQGMVDILSTLKEKVINAANDTNTDADRAIIQKELEQAVDQLDSNAVVSYNGKIMLDGSMNNEVLSPGTKTVLANESLDPSMDFNTLAVDAKDVSGRSLGIRSDSRIEFSYVIQGKTYITTLDPVGEDTYFTDMFSMSTDSEGNPPDPESISMDFGNTLGKDRTGTDVKTTHGESALYFTAGASGIDGQIAGLTINVVNKDGTPNRTANSVLNDFYEAIRAENTSPDNASVFQVGTKANQSVKVGFSDMRAKALGLRSADGDTLSVATQKKANVAICVLDLALQKVLNMQTTVGSIQSRLNFTVSNLTVSNENTNAAESVITDSDMAKEMTAYTKNNVLVQASQSMLAQANQSSSSVLSLLQ